jgi:hypothetical protein
LKVIYNTYKPFAHKIFCGDFNFDSTHNFSPSDTRPLENLFLESYFQGYADVWRLLRPDEAGYTFDTRKNLMLATHKHEQMRYDRIMNFSQGQSGDWAPVQVEMYGTTPFTRAKNSEGIPLNIHLSDHFALMARFTWNPK